jgi:two-component system, NtrC family, nitrogen regulation response regulator GlnG
LKRDLEALVLDAVARYPGGTLSPQSFKEAIDVSAPVAENVMQPDIDLRALTTLFPDHLRTLREAEAALIAEALRRAEGNQGVAAGMLGLSRQALNKRAD